MERYPQQIPQQSPKAKRPQAKKKRLGMVLWIVLGMAALCVAGAVCFGFLMQHIFAEVRNGEEAAAFLAERAEKMGFDNALSELSVVDSVRVGEHTYYRLQQNYHGIPVIGRRAVVVADERNKFVGSSHNLQDIPESLWIEPTIEPIHAAIAMSQYIQDNFPEAYRGSYSLPENMQLCVYDLDGEACLAYTFRAEGMIWVVDAQNARVLNARNVLLGLHGNSGALPGLSDSLNLKGREYAKKAKDKEIYLYSAATQTYYAPRQRTFYVQRLWPVDMADSSLGNILIQQNRYDNAAAALDILCGFADCFAETLDISEDGPMILVMDDFLDGQTACLAAGGWGTAREFLGYQKPEALEGREDAGIGMVILGSEMMLDPTQVADAIGHEYMHVLTDKRVGWCSNDPQTWALNEGISDLMGQVLQAMLAGENAQPDWNTIFRPLADPQSRNYPVYAGQYGEYSKYQVLPAHPEMGESDTVDYAVFYSTVISHAAYRMWMGVDGQALSTEQLAQLWYRTVLMLPANANFADCRRILTRNAQWMGLTQAQRQCVDAAFDHARIEQRQAPETTLEAGEHAALRVLDYDGEVLGGYRITVTEVPEEETLAWKEPVSLTRKMIFRQPCKLDLQAGIYRVELAMLLGNEKTVEFYLRIKAGGPEEVQIPTTFGAEEEEPQLILPGTMPTGPSEQVENEIPYTLQTWESSYTHPEQGWSKRYWVTYPELLGEDGVSTAINQDIVSAVREQIAYWQTNALTRLEQPYLDANGKPVSYEEGYEIFVSHNADGVLCLLLSQNGVPYDSMFYSLRTATPLWNYMLAGRDPEGFLAEIKKSIWRRASELESLPVDDTDKAMLDRMQLEDFRFAMVEEELVVLGLFNRDMIPTGIRYRTDYIAQMENGMKTFTKADAVGVETVEWNRNYDVPMQDPRAKERHTTYECDYLRLLGDSVPMAQINNTIYDIAAKFMQDKTDAQIRADWFDYGVHRGFWMNGNMAESYNANGIFSLQMQYYGHLGSMYAEEDKSNFEGEYGMAFDVQTGRQLTLSDVTGVSEEVLRVLLLERRCGPQSLASLRHNILLPPGSPEQWAQWLENSNLEQCSVAVAKDGEILVYIPKAIQTGMLESAGQTYFAYGTGLYVGTRENG